MITGRTYVLLIENNKNRNVSIGRLGTLEFAPGIYAYIGSAKKNLWTRIRRHKSTDKKRFWHIDYLLNCKTSIKEVWISSDAAECSTAQFFLKRGCPYIKDFGSSDCRCPSHLFYINQNWRKTVNWLKKKQFRRIAL